MRLPREDRVRLLGREPLEPEEVSLRLYIRLPEAVAVRVLKLSPKERGLLLMAGLEVENAETNH